MMYFYYYDEDREAADEDQAAEKPAEAEKQPIKISLYYFNAVMDE